MRSVKAWAASPGRCGLAASMAAARSATTRSMRPSSTSAMASSGLIEMEAR